MIDNRVGHAAYHCLLEMQFAKALAGQTESPLSLTDAEYDETRDLEAICKTDNFNQITYYFVSRMRLEYYYGNYQKALEFAARALPLRAAFQGQVAEIDFCFFHALALIARARLAEPEAPAPLAEPDAPARELDLTQARDILAHLDRWAESCPANFRPKALLVRAELAGMEEGPNPEIASYDEAAAFACQAGYPHHAALALELAGAHSLRRGHGSLARRYLATARRAYQNWGALAKAQDVSRCVPRGTI